MKKVVILLTILIGLSVADEDTDGLAGGRRWLNGTTTRMGYGIQYEYWGKLRYNLDRYDMMLGVKLPTFNFTANHYMNEFADFDSHCQTIDKRYQDMIDVCYYVWPFYYYYRVQEESYQYQIAKILTKDLPAILPGYESDIDIENVGPYNSDPEKDPLYALKVKHWKYLEELEKRQGVRPMGEDATNVDIHYRSLMGKRKIGNKAERHRQMTTGNSSLYNK